MKRHVHTYEEMAKIGQRYYNDTNFCSVVAVATAAQVAFGKARAMLAKEGRINRKGTIHKQQVNALNKLDCELVPFYHMNLGTTVGKVARSLPSNRTFLIWIRGHVICVDNKVMNDWTSEGRRHRVRMVVEVIRNFESLPQLSH